MANIQTLSPHVADMIAAGEVVERPASVVKELLENAIDAGATALVVEIQRGGMASIRITDNGSGIAREQLPTAFLRHATSKLRSAEELTSIDTLGFRGEALAAISAVSRVDIFSRERGAASGGSLSLEGGIPAALEETGCPEGTTIVVRDLFFNTPARLKFMKTDSAEASAVASVVQKTALSHPELSIRYIRDGKEELLTPGDGKLLSAIYAARGRDFAHSLTYVEGTGEDGISVHGYVTKPLEGRGSRSMQTFFCRGRLIKSPLLTAALEEAYANRQMKGRFPGSVLHVDLPADMVDVNVHPAKTVVKFLHERAVFSAVHHIVSDALDALGRPVSPKPAPAVKAAARQDFYQTMDAETFRRHVSGGTAKPSGGSSSVRKNDLREAPDIPSFFRNTGSSLEKAPVLRTVEPHLSPASSDAGSASLSTKVPSFVENPRKFSPVVPLAKQPEAVSFTLPVKHVEPVAQLSVPLHASTPKVDTEEPAEQIAFVPDTPAPWRLIGEIFHTYIVAEDGDTVWLIDKHAAHERINFDRLKANPAPVMRQQLLTPEVVEISEEQYAVLLDNLPLLSEFGFLVEDFGQRALVVREVPSDIPPELIRETFEMLADQLLISGHADPAAAHDAMLHTMACKAAIKGGWVSDPEELRALIGKVQSGEVQYCPHGRPVNVKITRYELEKMFKRA